VRLPIALLLLLPAAALAHNTPIAPSSCAVEPLTLSVPVRGLSGQAAPASPRDALRIAWDSAAGIALLCAADPAQPANACADAVPRPFTLGGVSGTLTLPAIPAKVFVVANVGENGDVVVSYVPYECGAGAPTSGTMTLTTGLVGAADAVAEGSPLDHSGTFTLVGLLPARVVDASLGDASLIVRLSCTATPAPDFDQFGPTPALEDLRGTISARGKVTLRAVLDQVPPNAPPLPGHPVILRVRNGDDTIASAFLPAGLAGKRRLTGSSPDGHTHVTLRPVRGQWIVEVRMTGAAVPAPHSTLVDFALDVGGLFARGERLFRPLRGPRVLKAT
jgi:hypothetical protein